MPVLNAFLVFLAIPAFGLVVPMSLGCHPGRLPIDYRKPGYDRFTTFIYRLETADSGRDLFRADTIALFCSNVVMPEQDSQLVMQWQYVSRNANSYVLRSDIGNNISTGLKISDRELYIHPPREGVLRELQFIPHPLFRDLGASGNDWTWDLVVGKYWSTPPHYLIQSIDTFHFSYRVGSLDTTLPDWPGRNCTRIDATSISRFCGSSATYYFERGAGLVEMALCSFGRRYHFTLVDKLEGHASTEFNPAFRQLRDRRNQGRWY